MIETINKLVRTSRQMLHEIGPEPTPDELAVKLAMPVDKVEKVLKIAKEPISLETPIGTRRTLILAISLRTRMRSSHWTQPFRETLRETTTRVLASLTAREERVLRMRFGIRNEHRSHPWKRLANNLSHSGADRAKLKPRL